MPPLLDPGADEELEGILFTGPKTSTSSEPDGLTGLTSAPDREGANRPNPGVFPLLEAAFRGEAGGSKAGKREKPVLAALGPAERAVGFDGAPGQEGRFIWT